MRQTLAWILGIGVTLLLVGLIAIRSGLKERPSVVLTDGSRVELYSVTHGTNHVVDLRSPLERILQVAPKWLVSGRWNKTVARREFHTQADAVVLWLRTGVPFATAVTVTVTDTNGAGGFISAPERLASSTGPHPMILKEWPRRAPEIALTFMGDPERKFLGRWIVPNPARSTAPLFTPSSVHQKGKNRTLELELVSLDVLPRGEAFQTYAGPHWGCRARFQIRESGVTNQDWVVQSMWLCDSGGNRRGATGPRKWTNDVFEIFGAPLWQDDPVWKVEADLTRAANFSPEETVTFSGVTMPLRDSASEVIYRTNLLGHAITLHSMRQAQISLPVGGVHSMGAPGFAIELDSRDPLWVPKIISVVSDSGENLRVPAHGYGDGYAIMRFVLPNGVTVPKSLTIRATVQKRQRFELSARAGVVESE